MGEARWEGLLVVGGLALRRRVRGHHRYADNNKWMESLRSEYNIKGTDSRLLSSTMSKIAHYRFRVLFIIYFGFVASFIFLFFILSKPLY